MIKKYFLSAMALAALTLPFLTTATPIPNPIISEPLALSKTHTPSLTKRSAAVVITQCTVANAFAVTFDDGPGAYTNELLDYLDIKKIKVTFFVNGQNYNNILDPKFSAMVKRAYDAGHQIASHTWSHADISLAATNINEEMTKREYSASLAPCFYLFILFYYFIVFRTWCITGSSKWTLIVCVSVYLCILLTNYRISALHSFSLFTSIPISGQRTQGHHWQAPRVHAPALRQHLPSGARVPGRERVQGRQLERGHE